jgi:uridine kinase
LVAIVGGSGSGKTWLAEQLHRELGKEVSRISLDDFYRDRSHLSLARRSRVNFDHPRSIDWNGVRTVLTACRRGQPVRAPRYDFSTHACLGWRPVWRPKRLVLVEGLWLLRAPAVRRLFDLRVYIDCPESLRFQRRLDRDGKERGRTRESIQEQFFGQVAPMHERFVAPQKRWADVVLGAEMGAPDVRRIAEELRHRPLQDVID